MAESPPGRGGSPRGLRWALAAVSALAVLAFGLLIGSRQRQLEANLERVLARQALLEADSSPATGLLLALEAARHRGAGAATPAASALRSILPRIYRSETIIGPEGTRQISAAGDGSRSWLAVLDTTGAVFAVDRTRSTVATRVAAPASSALALSPDGTWLAAAGVDGSVRLWRTESLVSEARTALRHPGAVTALAFHPSARWLAVGGGLGTRLYPLDGESPEAGAVEVPRPDGTDLAALAFSPDGRWLAAAPRATRPDGRGWPVQIWDLSGLPELPPQPEELYQAGEATSLAFSRAPGGELLATAHRDGRVLLWKRESDEAGGGSWSGELLRQAWFGISTLAFDPSGLWLATASELGGRPSVLWQVDPSTGRFGTNRRVVQTDGPSTALAFSPNGLELAAGGGRQAPGVWNLIGPALVPVALPHGSRVGSLVFSGDGTRLATSSREGVKLWDLEERPAAAAATLGEGRRVSRLVSSAGSPLFAMSDRDGAVSVVAPTAAGVEQTFERELAEGVRLMGLSPDGRWLAVSPGDEGALLWDLSDPESEAREVLGPPGPAEEVDHEMGFPVALEFDPLGRWLAQLRSDGTVALGRLPEAGAGSGAGRPRARSTREIAYAFSANGRWLAVGAAGGETVRVWDLSDESPRAAAYGTPPGLLALAFDGDADLLKLAILGGGTRALVSAMALGSSAPTPTASLDHPSGLQDALLSDDGRWLVTVSGDLTARLIDTSPPDGDGEVARLPHAAGIQGLEFSPGGRWLATTSLDGVVRLWALEIEDLIEIGCRSLAAERRGFSRGEWERIFPPMLHAGGPFPPLRYRGSYAEICPGG